MLDNHEEYMSRQQSTFQKKLGYKYDLYNNEAINLHTQFEDLNSLLKSEKLFMKALNLAQKNQFAKAATYHNLGTFYYSHYDELPGSYEDNLKLSIQYFERALCSKERSSFLDRKASTLTSYGNALRRAATLLLWQEIPDACYLKAEKLHMQAAHLLQKGVPGLIKARDSATVFCNLSSLLIDAKREMEGCEALYTSYNNYLEYLSYPDYNFHMKELDPETLFSLVYSRLSFYGSDIKKYRDTCSDILEFCQFHGINTAKITSTNPLLDRSITEHKLINYILKLRNNYSKSSIENILKIRSNLFLKRQNLRTDQAADEVAVQIQFLTSGLVREFCKKGDELAAFAHLEYASAMRFTEGLSHFWFMPDCNVVYELYQMQMYSAANYYFYNNVVLYIEQSEPENIKGYIEDCIVRFKNNALELGKNYADFVNVFTEALENELPINTFKKYAAQKLAEHNKIEKKIYSTEPSFKQKREQTYSVTSADICTALNKYPDLTLVKIDIENGYDDILIIVAFMENNEVVIKSHSIDKPSSILGDIQDYSRTQDKKYLNTWDFSFVDWREILPKGRKQVGLLTSFFASGVPWGATGNQGSKLQDLVDEVLWLPSIMTLLHQVNYLEPRDTIYRVAGGNTKFTEYSHLNYSELSAPENKESYVQNIKLAKIMSYYGHCEHHYPDKPTLLFKDYSIKDIELGEHVRGANRIEFWACQSGSNIPPHILGSPVNEAFGSDMLMLQCGAETSIGTLWAVPEFVTSHIKRYYDFLVNEGVKASIALLSAQRWWTNEGADQQVSLIDKVGMSEYLSRLGYGGNSSDIEVMMGPVFTKKEATLDLEKLRDNLKHPSAWAGLRFCGLPENKAKYIPESEIELNDSEKVKLKNIIKDLNLSSGSNK